jgi:hypothetical protein
MYRRSKQHFSTDDSGLVPFAWFLTRPKAEAELPVFSLSSKAINNTASVVLSCALWVAVVIMGFLLHGEMFQGYGREAYQQRPVYNINGQA